jgi:protein O-GlcNAc transferase
MNSHQSEIEQKLTNVFTHYKRGELVAAKELCQQILQLQPEHVHAMFVLGVIYQNQENFLAAIDIYEKIVSINPNIVEVYINLAAIEIELGNIDKGILYSQKSIALQPNKVDGYVNLGHGLRLQGNLEAAVKAYQQAIQINPHLPECHALLGVIFQDLGQIETAILYLQTSVTLSPQNASFHNSLGNALIKNNRWEEAIAHYQQALALSPQDTDFHYNLANALQTTGKLAEAIAHYQKCLDVITKNADFCTKYANALQKTAKFAEAITYYRLSLQLKPQNPVVHNNLGRALKHQGKIAEAITHYQLAFIQDPTSSTYYSNYLLCLHYQPHPNPQAILAEHQKWAEKHASPYLPSQPYHHNELNPHPNLRIGYISPDFCTHPVAYFIKPILEAHNRQKVTVFCYADVAKIDETTQILQQLPLHWRNIWQWSDDQVSQLIQADKIDILVDLTGHTGDNRMLLFARQPAPVQVNYLGYPASTGLSTIDYRITDSYADPIGQTEEFHTETLIRLPETFLCYQPASVTPDVAPTPCLKNGYITFGSCNNLAKMTTEVISCWFKLLKAVPNSRLLLKYQSLSQVGSQERFLELLKQEEIAPERLIFRDVIRNYQEHLAVYNQIDIALDTFPYNGTTTTCEALWMGVPVVVLSGISHVGRVGVSILKNVGLDELIADSVDGYIELARNLANQPEQLQQIRQQLRNKMKCSPLLDSSRFTTFLEEKYQQMWEQYCVETEKS